MQHCLPARLRSVFSITHRSQLTCQLRPVLYGCSLMNSQKVDQMHYRKNASFQILIAKIQAFDRLQGTTGREERCNVCEPAFIVTESVNNIGKPPVHAAFNAIFYSSLYDGASLPLVTPHTFPNDEFTAKFSAWLWHLSHPVSPDTMRRQSAMHEKEIKQRNADRKSLGRIHPVLGFRAV